MILFYLWTYATCLPLNVQMMVKDQKNHKEPRKNAHQHQATMINQVTTIKPCLPSLHTIFKFITPHLHCLVVVGLSGGLTSVIQMCDLVANKLLKQLMCGGYYQCALPLSKTKKQTSQPVVEISTMNVLKLRSTMMKWSALLRLLWGLSIGSNFKQSLSVKLSAK